MKKTAFIVLLVFCSIKSTACDICGCGVGNNYIGVLPEFRKHIIGMRYRYNSIITHVGVGGASTYLTTNEHYQTIELWGGFQLSPKWRLLSNLPYSFNNKLNSTGKTTKQGIGDISNTLFYQLVNTKTTLKNQQLLINSLWLGAGIKLPLGKYNPVDKSTSSSNNLFQLGTGSTDFSLAAMYDLRYYDAGLNMNTNYKITTANNDHYQYGNKFTFSSSLYYKINIQNKVTLVPNIGFVIEQSAKDADFNEVVDISGGRVTMSSIGLEATIKKIAFGVNFQEPQYQNLALGTIKANSRTMVHISFLL